VNRASLGPIAAHNDPETVTKIVTEVKGTVNEPEQAGAELLEVPAEEVEAPGGFEPPHRSFADCSLSHLGTAPSERHYILGMG
jgi:hypothetical protein